MRTRTAHRPAARRLAALLLAGALAACGGGGGAAVTPDTAPDTVVARPWREVLDTALPHSIVGDVRIIPAFPMPQLRATRRVWVYLPAGYESGTTRYPVLYMQDGQNLFDGATSYAGEWGIDESMMQMAQADPRLAAIVVGIDNAGTGRTDEYTPQGHADAYVDFLTTTLKPYVDGHFRTLPDRGHTAIGGSSLGAYVSLYAAVTRQAVFGQVAAFSDITIYDGGTLQRVISQQGRQQDIRFYTDIGQPEDARFPGCVEADRQTLALLQSLGFTQSTLLVDPAGVHDEASWRRRFPGAWQWLNP